MSLRQLATHALLLAATAGHVFGQIVSYEASSDQFPEEQGWDRVLFCTPERAIEDGWLVESLVIGDCAPKPGGDRDAYTRNISSLLATSDAFFYEARALSDGPSTEFTWQGPATVDFGSLGPVGYGLTYAGDQVKLFRDALLPVVFVALDPKTEHTFRLELFGANLYIWYIDGEVVDSGIPEGPYPSNSPGVNFTFNAFETGSTTQFRYLRFGRIPDDASGDWDSDQQIDDNDAPFFAECMLGPGIDAGPGCRSMLLT